MTPTDDKPMTVDALTDLAQQLALAHFNPSLTSTTLDEYRRSFRAAIEQYGQEREAAGRGSGEPVMWLPMDTAPKDGRKILLWWGDRVVYGHWLDNLKTSVPWSGWRGPSLEPMRTGQPSHWMPLPGSPNAVPQSREPLTKQELIRLWREPYKNEDHDSWFVEFARAVERAHGITGETK